MGRGSPAMPFNGSHQGGFLATDKCAGAHADLDIKIKCAAHNLLTEQTVIPGLIQCGGQAG